MNLLKRFFTRTKPRPTPPSSDPPFSVTQTPTGVQEPTNEPLSPTVGALPIGTTKSARNELVGPQAPTLDRYAEDVGDEESGDADMEGGDSMFGLEESLKIDLPTNGEILCARAEAEHLALATAHRITPNDPAGPGSLAEALGRLEAEGRVHSEIVDDPEVGFCILYRPLACGPMTGEAVE